MLAEAATSERITCSPYEEILGDAFDQLHPNVRSAHLVPLNGEGTVAVEHGAHWLVPLLVRIMRLPDAGPKQQVKLQVVARGTEVEWNRTFGESSLRTYQYASGSQLVERNTAGAIRFTGAIPVP